MASGRSGSPLELADRSGGKLYKSLLNWYTIIGTRPIVRDNPKCYNTGMKTAAFFRRPGKEAGPVPRERAIPCFPEDLKKER